MKFTSQEEYGLRLLVRLGYAHQVELGLTIPEISKKENITEHNVAKILRVLRLGGFLESERGRTGGYTLTRKPKEINIGDVMNVLSICSNTPDCSIRSFWKILQTSIDNVMDSLSLQDLMVSENFFYKEANKKFISEEIS